MADYSKFYKARKIISDIMHKDLIGPVDKNEVIPELPTQYYIMGKLYPQGDSEEVIDLVRNPILENAVETYDASISLSNQKNPASLGVTCTLKSGVTNIQLLGSYAFYNPISFEEAEKSGIDVSRWMESEKKPSEFWVRQQYEFREEFFLEGKETLYRNLDEQRKLQVQVYTHSILDTGERIITIALVNENQAGNDLVDVAQKCAFQVELSISSTEEKCIFSATDRREQFAADEEQLEMQLLYSEVKCYGQGHGCSVEWDMEHEEPYWVSSAWFPSYNLSQMMAATISDNTVLSMKVLSESEPQKVIDLLKNFANSYKDWIEEQRGLISSLEERYRHTADSNMQKCEEAYIRILHSINLLEDSLKTDKAAMKAFQMANEAMLLQRRQTLEKSGKTFKPEEVTWYPFQLAFILHELSSFIDPTREERNVVDLLWFPTGGGKTEAYLGIAAFVIFLRRIRNANDDGVTVIMRYTLRLLTLQQFERASMMICACELLRQKYDLGEREISIGLWVGDNLTPNSLEKARSSIRKLQVGAVVSLDESNPFQVQVCPWCGARLSVQDYEVKLDEKRMMIRCPNEKCDFHSSEKGLPIHIIDDAIYAHLPSFIVATVDKFAQIPLSEKPAALFGISSQKNPPELIIQDELHLISGPLGTITGIYEAVVTKLCEKNGIGAKIIASTATIRNAESQILALYGRKHTQFPPQGISVSDSYFAVESTPEQKPARQYFGVMGIGTTTTTTLVRVNAALLFASRYLVELGFEDDVIDDFWTITGYFNSLRELGGASTQIMDDVQGRFRYLANTKFAKMDPRVDTSKDYDFMQELTSRMDSAQITEVIQVGLNRKYKNGRYQDAYDFVLASNMISVGVDVGRLGTMVVAGQPKTNAEYIQATSRVGRENPGIVITVYNSSRSRDRSHYEQFLKYHSALYRYVEATSLTPFADRARDRGLQALYVSLCRYLVPGLLKNEQAAYYNSSSAEVRKIYDIICEYVKKVDAQELDAVMNELQEIEDEWDAVASGPLVYKGFKDEKSLLKNDTENDRFRIMNSMRSVDAQAGIYLLGR